MNEMPRKTGIKWDDFEEDRVLHFYGTPACKMQHALKRAAIVAFRRTPERQKGRLSSGSEEGMVAAAREGPMEGKKKRKTRQEGTDETERRCRREQRESRENGKEAFECVWKREEEQGKSNAQEPKNIRTQETGRDGLRVAVARRTGANRVLGLGSRTSRVEMRMRWGVSPVALRRPVKGGNWERRKEKKEGKEKKKDLGLVCAPGSSQEKGIITATCDGKEDAT